MIIKGELFNLKPSTYDMKYEIDKYCDKAYKKISDIFDILKNEYFIFEGKKYFNYIDKYKSEILMELLECNGDISKLNKFYNDRISNISRTFLDDVKENVVGYYELKSIDKPLESAKSINELLHLLHADVLNSDSFYKNIPVLMNKKTPYDVGTISLRGEKSDFGVSVFNSLNSDIFMGDVDIIAFKNNVLLMARDIGHCLTVELTKNNDEVRANYFIPKICNVDMAKRLPGISSIKDDSIGATGVFYANEDDFFTMFNNFLEKVPTDKDIGKNYNESFHDDYSRKNI